MSNQKMFLLLPSTFFQISHFYNSPALLHWTILFNKSKKEVKDQESIQSSTTPDPG